MTVQFESPHCKCYSPNARLQCANLQFVSKTLIRVQTIQSFYPLQQSGIYVARACVALSQILVGVPCLLCSALVTRPFTRINKTRMYPLHQQNLVVQHSHLSLSREVTRSYSFLHLEKKRCPVLSWVATHVHRLASHSCLPFEFLEPFVWM